MSENRLPQLTGYIVTAVGLLVAILLGQFAGQGDTKQIFLVFVACGGVAVFLLLGKYYWMLLPFAFSSGIPAIPIGGKTLELGELAAAGCTVVFLMHLAFKRGTLRLNNLPTLFVFIAFAWTVIIYVRNPIGFAMFGSEAVGFRDYQRIILGVCSFLVLSNQHIGEKEAKWLIVISIVGAFLGLAWGFVDGAILGRDRGIDDEGNEYTWHQALAGPAYTVALWMFCRYKSSQIIAISHPARLPAYLFCVFVALESGKRAMFGSIFLVPAFAAALRKEWKHLILYIGGALLMVSILVAGHGKLFELPFRVQRSMANLPGDWDPNIQSLTAEGGDGFRTVMRELAWEKIQKNPIIGKGLGFTMEDVAGINISNYAQNIHAALAAGNSWHNTWLGLWADFGLPAAIFHAFIFLSYLAVAISNFNRTDRNSHLGVYSMMILIGLFFTLFRSYTSGSSNVAFYFYWHFAIAVGIWQTLSREVRAKRNPSQNFLTPGQLSSVPAQR